jgi:hypothetical protein
VILDQVDDSSMALFSDALQNDRLINKPRSDISAKLEHLTIGCSKIRQRASCRRGKQ